MIARRLIVSLVGVVLPVLLGVSTALCCPIHYVKPDGSDTNDGCTWATAKQTVQAGLNNAASGDEVWVAAGTYVERITLKSGVGLYGGFAGTETSRDQRNWTANPAVLDGNKGGSVVTSPEGATASTVIDGFTIRNGNATDAGGILCRYDSSATITHNTITANSAIYGGGGIWCNSSSATIAYNTITANSASDDGGGIYCYGSSPTIAHNTITGNSATDSGGGIYCDYYSSPSIANEIITANSATDSGGGIYCDGGTPTITNNTITANTAGLGGGIYCLYSSPTIKNNIVADNSSGVYDASGGVVVLNNCVYNPAGENYSGLSPGWTDIQLDPLFADGWGGNYHLAGSSPCIDAGDSSVVQAGWVDMDLEPRIAGTQVDIGADEAAPVRVALPLAGWHIIAQPHQGDHPLRDTAPVIMVSNNGGAPVPFCDAVLNGWLQSPLYGWDDAGAAYLSAGCDPWDDGALLEGKGYWLMTYAPNLTLIFP